MQQEMLILEKHIHYGCDYNCSGSCFALSVGVFTDGIKLLEFLIPEIVSGEWDKDLRGSKEQQDIIVIYQDINETWDIDENGGSCCHQNLFYKIEKDTEEHEYLLSLTDDQSIIDRFIKT